MTKDQAIEMLDDDKKAKCNSDIQKKTDIEKLVEFIKADNFNVASEYLKLCVAAINPKVIDFIDFSKNAIKCIIKMERSDTSTLSNDFLNKPIVVEILAEKDVLNKGSKESQKIIDDAVEDVIRDFINKNIKVSFSVKKLNN